MEVKVTPLRIIPDLNLHLYLENVFSIENYLQRYLYDKINKVLRSDKKQSYSTIKINHIWQ